MCARTLQEQSNFGILWYPYHDTIITFNTKSYNVALLPHNYNYYCLLLLLLLFLQHVHVQVTISKRRSKQTSLYGLTDTMQKHLSIKVHLHITTTATHHWLIMAVTMQLNRNYAVMTYWLWHLINAYRLECLLFWILNAITLYITCLFI